MKKGRHVRALAPLALVVLGAGQTMSSIAASFVPPEGQKLLIVGQDLGSIGDYVSAVGHAPAGVTGYTGITTLAGFATDGEWGAGINNAATLVKTYPDSVLVLGIALEGRAKEFARGDYDSNLDTLIGTLKRWNRPVLLRWGYEVEGPWNNHPPQAFKDGWIKVWNRIRALGAEGHVAMVWQTATYCGDGISVAKTLDWYPGDRYVDWMAMSYFTPQDCGSNEIRDMIALARRHAKPLLIAEASPQRYDLAALTYSTDAARGSHKQRRTAAQIWAEWFVPLFELIDANGDVIRGLAYINCHWHSQSKWNPDDGIGPPEGYWGDSRVQAQASIRADWSARVGDDSWLDADRSLFGKLGFAAPGRDPAAQGADVSVTLPAAPRDAARSSESSTSRSR